jgi:glycerol-3-phosphate acyltransferase PlsX
MVSAGNTGATMASALLRMGRIRGVSRPAIATPLPRPGHAPLVLLDAGANAECEPSWLVQFGQMGAVFARDRFGTASPRVGLLSIGEEAGKGSPFVKATFELMSAADWATTCGASFVGNVEGRDLMGDLADVVVTDGFTGNVALKSMEGAVKAMAKALLEVFSDPEHKAAAESLLPALAPLYATFSPETYGGAMLLGVDGVCVISHGSSNATAIVNALRVASEMVQADVVAHLRAAVGRAPEAVDP